MKTMYIVAGCNGAGKTTAFNFYLSKFAEIPVFINADEIARDMCPDDVESVQFRAGRVFLENFSRQLERGESFCIETTLASRTIRSRIEEAHEAGFSVALFFYYLSTPDHAVIRVAQRVASGGHNIPIDVILRRYRRGIANLLDLYIGIVDYWRITDNSQVLPKLVASSDDGIIDPEKFDAIRNMANKELQAAIQERPVIEINHLWQISDSNMVFDVVNLGATVNYIRELLESKARRGEDVSYSIDGRLVVLSAVDVNWLFNKLFIGVDDWELDLLRCRAENREDMVYFMDGCTIAIPARLVLGLLETLSDLQSHS